MAFGKPGRAGKPAKVDETGSRDGDLPSNEAVLLALVAQTEQLNERLTNLEDRFDAAMSTSDEVDTDLQDLRVNSARLAAELQRVTAELRSDIDEINLTEPNETADSDPTLRLPGAQGQSGWLPVDD